LETAAIHQNLLDRFGPEIILNLQPAVEGIRDPFIGVRSDALVAVSQYCHENSELKFDFCQSITGMDNGEQLTAVYHLFSYSWHHTLVLKVTTLRTNPRLPSCVSIWPAANWYEREIFDLFGVFFDGHPDLRRLLLPDDWPGHPMLKDWQEPASYNGMSTSRENPLDRPANRPAEAEA
jgi:NADH-quinone oxidoreductase subunit C